MGNLAIWREAGKLNGWRMPYAPWWKRLPVIRHIRALLIAERIGRWYRHGPGSIGLRTGYDDWVLVGIWHGLEEPDHD
ncbi:hypothetical protein HW532_15580 [Kaustia mangrovi]|uniref:Uncharacterized protein n=1 Tax=Kaustia mangrovi TaxID=2593653 RepID=A0A7S8C5W5_9HYPH|nr:hypothetical protein [Kaustia mangrovi]QPC43985.1 hypothetical protein HW532_15580 [Kaustia mangrovi]